MKNKTALLFGLLTFLLVLTTLAYATLQVGYESATEKKFALNALAGMDETALKNGVKNIDDLEDAVRGGERLIASSTEGLGAIPFSQVDNVAFLKSVGEAEKGFEISEEGFKKIKFVDGDEIFFNIDDQTIYISKNADSNLLNKVAIFHEFGHAKVYDSVGDFKKIVKSVPTNKVDEATSAYEEFIADFLSFKKVKTFDLDENLAVITKPNIEKMVKEEPDLVAHLRALSKKAGKLDKLSLIDGVLKNADKGTDIKSLSEKFVSYSDLLEMPKAQQITALDDIAKSTLNLIGGG